MQLIKYQITIDEIVIEVTRKNIKNIRLVIHRTEGRVRISVPLHVDEEILRQFVVKKLPWIKKHHSKPPKTDYLFISGEIHYFQGKSYLLNLTERDCKPKVEIRDDSYLDIHLPPGSDPGKGKSLLLAWYKEYLDYSIPSYIKHWEPILNVQVKKWGIKLMKTRWGSCNFRDRRIWLNLELAKHAPQCIEYVVVHEMVHLLEPNHGSKFIDLMDQHLPDWRIIRKQLNGV